MDPESLRCFLAVADSLHFRSAASQVALSAAAVTDRVKRLESDLGVELFVRTTRRVVLTDAGRRLQPHARQLVEALDRCATVAKGDGQPLPFDLTLGSRHELALSWLCPALAPLEMSCPERRIHLHLGDTPALLDRLDRGLIDACILSARVSRSWLSSAPLHVEEYRFVGSQAGLEDAAGAVGYTLLDVSSDLPLWRYLSDVLPEAADWRFGNVRLLGGIGIIREQVLAGRGVAVLPQYYVHEDLAAGRLVELLPDRPPSSDRFRMLWRRDHPRGSEIARLVEELREIPIR